jgi:hypothetical protein
VQKKREWMRISFCSEGQQATGRESVTGEEFTFHVSCFDLCASLFFFISCFALVNEAQAKKIKSIHGHLIISI